MSNQILQNSASASQRDASPANIARGEELLSLTEATKVMPKVNGKRPAVSTLWRWCRRGLNGVRLEYLRIGRNIVTSREALDRFFAALAAADAPLAERPRLQVSLPTKINDKARQRSIDDAERILQEAGI